MAPSMALSRAGAGCALAAGGRCASREGTVHRNTFRKATSAVSTNSREMSLGPPPIIPARPERRHVPSLVRHEDHLPAHSGHLTACTLAYPSTSQYKSPLFDHFNTSHKVVVSEQTWSLHECDGLSEEELSVNTAECERVGLGLLGTVRPAAPVLAKCSGSQRTHKKRHLRTQWVSILSSSSRIRHCNRKPRGSAPGCAALTPAQTHSIGRRLRTALCWLHSVLFHRALTAGCCCSNEIASQPAD